MDAAGFLYYAPDPQGRQQKQHGHHGHFLAQPNAYISATPQLLAPTPIHFPSQLVLGGRGVPLTITPSASPSLMESYIPDMCTESATTDLLFNPATPPLTHSAVSTPSIPYAMPTPIGNHGWSSEEPVIATVSLSDIQLPGTPADYFPPGLVAPSILKSNASPPPSISLNDMHCPALSPCSSQDSFAESSDCCDLREISAAQSPASLEVKPDIVFPPMPSLSGDDDQFLFGGSVESFLPLSASKAAPYVAGDYNEELSDLGDSEDDFIQNFSESVFSNKRMRFDDDSENEQLPSPPMSTSSSRQGSVAPIKALKRKAMKPKREDDDDCEEMTEEQRLRSFKFGSIDSTACSSPSSPCADKPMIGHPISPHVIRRGRKQSLTEDPSKTFVCHLCTRRFRRQEHLKRHFRSLHTEDKPFSCGECGKKFSRSDNLTQHSRIHGTGAVVLGVLTEGEVPVLGSQFGPLEEECESPQPFIVVDSMAAASGEIKDKSSEDKKSRKKRKRSDE
ncbi:hypothetical protein H072_2958 [Dactylellina haptotyla CBS 200.50]|uniref:C2H2-type domain-containing protein n=1 Tax=Dactylellina haptotyla (strain CBS 200.50) TaxID=1284197 RepID=S8AJF6_DACHA|nr:hypothetical protein H072_2958 [Dactylellina haptotyla CBS 200.50]